MSARPVSTRIAWRVDVLIRRGGLVVASREFDTRAKARASAAKRRKRGYATRVVRVQLKRARR